MRAPSANRLVQDTRRPQQDPAAQAGVKQGDVITAYAGKSIKSTRDLAMAVADTPAGHGTTITVWRDNHSHSLDVTIRTQDQARVANTATDNRIKPVGMSLEALTPDLRGEMNIPPGVSGVLVGAVTPGSHAEESGVRVGDVIERIGGESVVTPR